MESKLETLNHRFPPNPRVVNISPALLQYYHSRESLVPKSARGQNFLGPILFVNGTEYYAPFQSGHNPEFTYPLSPTLSLDMAKMLSIFRNSQNGLTRPKPTAPELKQILAQWENITSLANQIYHDKTHRQICEKLCSSVLDFHRLENIAKQYNETTLEDRYQNRFRLQKLHSQPRNKRLNALLELDDYIN